MSFVAARYREFAPCVPLAGNVRALFSFTLHGPNAEVSETRPGRAATREIVFREGDPCCSALFADGHVSIVANLGNEYRIDGLWDPRQARPHAIGAMRRYHATAYGRSLVQVGAYLRPGQARALTEVPACEITDRIVALEDLWGPAGPELHEQLGGAAGEEERIAWLEAALLRRMAAGRQPDAGPLSIRGLANAIIAGRGRTTVDDLAQAAGVSRQHMTRLFRESVGVSPKLYSRLTRFRFALQRAGSGGRTSWAQMAAATGYSDQSHMIAEFKQFSGLTPEAFVSGGYFHPFQSFES
jgi:AraC-like DNA-binding protein